MFKQLLRHIFCHVAVALASVTSSCYDQATVTVVKQSSEGFVVAGLVNSRQCQRLCLYTTGCSSIVFDSGQMSSCTLILSSPESAGNQSGQGGSACKTVCEQRPCIYGQTCAPGFGQSNATYSCHTGNPSELNRRFVEITPSVLRCGQPSSLIWGEVTSVHKDRVLGSSSEYTCTSPFAFVGTNTSTCTYTGHWVGPGHCQLFGDASFLQVTGYNTSFIKMMTSERVTRDDAETECNTLYGAHLLAVDNDEKWNAVVSVLKQHNTYTGYVFVDGTDTYNNNTFYLRNGGTANIVQGWAPGEPDAYPQTCIAFRFETFVFYDALCSGKFAFICEFVHT